MHNLTSYSPRQITCSRSSLPINALGVREPVPPGVALPTTPTHLSLSSGTILSIGSLQRAAPEPSNGSVFRCGQDPPSPTALSSTTPHVSASVTLPLLGLSFPCAHCGDHTGDRPPTSQAGSQHPGSARSSSPRFGHTRPRASCVVNSEHSLLQLGAPIQQRTWPRPAPRYVLKLLCCYGTATGPASSVRSAVPVIPLLWPSKGKCPRRYY